MTMIYGLAEFAGGIIAGVIGFKLGSMAARDNMHEEAVNAAAEKCPTCGRADEAAERLEAINARISGVEYYGDPIGDCDPVEDANWILRVAMTHASRARFHRNKEAVRLARRSRSLADDNVHGSPK